ncbi:hypothetical protein PR202_gb27778 [Eleusine coracana subsp. coracana]|uniref:ABC transporter domain-containing protein n=1 Tax=Eleusine coracana subsp. coracana TaxID=191504 RepID=A0AAV5FUR2_ELECO|nr:hypothetical protein PR202_gb27778 [Eleusine coracana subsp. coracana]
MEPPLAAAGESAAAVSRSPSLTSQTNALLRKNLIFQKRNRKGTVRLILVPVYLCVILSVIQRVINNELHKPKYRCGCKCVDVNGPGSCQNVCGIQYSTLDQATSCAIPNPPKWPALVQVPLPEYRAVQDSSSLFTGLPDESCRESQTCPASIPFTGANRTLSTSVMQNLLTRSPLSNLSDFMSMSSLLLVSNAYLQFLQGSGVKILLDFTKEMPKQATRLTFDFSAVAGPLFFEWVVALLFPIVLSFLAATFFSKVNTAQAIAYLYIFGSGLMAGSLIRNFIEGGKFPRHWITALEIIPAFSLYRGLYELGQYAARASETGSHGMRWNNLNDHTNGMRDVLIIIVLEWLVLLPVAYYLDHAASVGHRYSLLSVIKCFLKKDPTWRKVTVNGVAGNDVQVEMEKVDIIKERETVIQVLQQQSSGYAVVCDDLKKVYHGKDGNPDKFAVQGVSLALANGECLGILGPNGAGKSSFISMMIGFVKPTSGNAFVRGFSIQNDMEKIYNSMGVCPQNDMLWETLTGREHLQFYGRLKSLSGSSLNLVVYMDEPSTGLDPASRKSLWNAVKQAKQDRAIILTSNSQTTKLIICYHALYAHSMEEAEALCDRLCIMVDGSLQCIGRPKELIARYGGYYVLTVTTMWEYEQEVENLARKLSPSARKVYHLSGTQKYELPKQDVKIADVFRAVENFKKRVEVQAWGLADTTMEDVWSRLPKGRNRVKNSRSLICKSEGPL